MFDFNIEIKQIIILLIILINCIISGCINSIIIIPLILLLFIYFILTNPQKYLYLLKLSYKYLTAFRGFIYFYCYLIFATIVLCIFNKANILRFFMSSTFGYVISIVMCYILGIYVRFLFQNNKKIIKLILNIIYIIIAVGFIDLITYKFMIPGLKQIFPIIIGRELESILLYKTYYSLPRIQSVFAEPSHYAWFLTCNIPIVMKIFESKYKIFKNNFVNILYKKSLMPLLFLSILLTQSPINLVFSIIIVVVYKIITSKVSIKHLLLISLVVLFFTISIMFLFKNINISETFMNRILLSVQVLMDLNKLIIVEPSLATRLISYINMGIIGLKHSILGVGWGNLTVEFVHQLKITNTPLTPELRGTLLAIKPVCNPSIFFKVFAETGFIGTMIFLSIFVNIFKTLQILSKFLTGIEKDYVEGVKLALIAYCVLIFYDSQLYCHYFWFLFGTISGVYLKEYLWLKKIKQFG